MKIIIILLLLGFISTTETYGQSHLKKDSLFTGIRETDDYSNLKVDKRAFKSGKTFWENLYADSTTIVILNNKIYSGNSKEYKELDFKSVVSYAQIKDDSSSSTIKCVLIIKTK